MKEIVLYILDTAKNSNPNGSNLKKVLEHSVRFSFLSLDSSFNAKQLFVSYCSLVSANAPFDTTISVGPATGGTQKTIYHQAPSICVHQLRVISPQTLLMTVESYKKKRAIAFFILAVIAAIGPTMDAFSMIFQWIALCLLYQLGIWLCMWSPRREPLDIDVPDSQEMVEV